MTRQNRPSNTYFDAAWTADQVARFWNYLAFQPAVENTFFSKQVGESLFRHTRAIVPIRGPVLDFGCGVGGLLDVLLKHRVPCAGLDSSDVAITVVNRNHAGNPLFQGARRIVGFPTDFSAGTFVTLFLIEVVEHVQDPDLGNLIEEARRLLQPGGVIIITTPNQEDLDFKKVACPECGCVFHRVQHVRSWSPGTLEKFLSLHGFEKVTCQETIFLPSLVLPGTVFSRLFRLLHWLGPGKTIIKYLPFGTGERLPHLFFAGRKIRD